MLKRGINNIRNHIYSENFNGEVAVQRACIVMYLTAAILTNQDNLPSFKVNDSYELEDIQLVEYGKLSYIKKMDKFAY